MEAKDLVCLKAKLFSKAKNELELKRGIFVWFFCRERHFIGTGEVRHVYPRDIGHGPEIPLCKIIGRIIDLKNRWTSFFGTIHQDDVCRTEEDAVRGLVKRLGKLYDKRRGEMLGFFHKQEDWRKKQ